MAPPRPWTLPDLLIVAALAAGGVGMAGVFLDTAWHRTIGRDSFFVLPHLFIYLGGLGIWTASLLAIVHASRGGGRAFGGPILRWGRARVPFGFGLAILGVLTVGAAAPVDVWWHWMYGKDALIWSFSHLMGHFGAGITAIGLLFVVAAQRGRGWFGRPAPWRVALLLVFMDLVHRGLFVQAHYTMIPESRTPDFYPFLSALLLPMVLVAATRLLGPWAAPAAATMFLGLALLADGVLRMIDFERYTVTPLVVIPALAVTTVLLAVGGRRDRAWVAMTAGLAFALVFTAVETLWMAGIVGRPWPLGRVLSGLPRSLAAGALSGWVGWVLGGFLRAASTADGVAPVFGSLARARAAAGAALLLAGMGFASTYQPQRFGSAMTPEELRLEPLPTLRYQEALFWEVLFQDDWWREERLETRSEGIIDGAPLPVGPAWCAASAGALTRDLARVRFGLSVNGAAVDLAAYPTVRVRMRDGAHCAWVAVASRFQRASENRFTYTLELAPADGTGGTPTRTRVDMLVVFKDP